MGDLLSGGAGANGKVSVKGKDDVPLAEMLAFDNEAVIGAGNKGRPGRLTMYDTNRNPTVNLTTADASLNLGGGNVNGKVSVKGKDSIPLVEMLALDNEAVIGAGNKNRPGRLTMFDKNGNSTVNLATTDASLNLGGGNVNGKVSVKGKDNLPLVELLALDNEAVIGAGNKTRPGRLTIYDANANPTVNVSAIDASVNVGSKGVNGKVSVVDKNGQPAAELLALDKEAVIGLGNHGHPGRLTIYNQIGETSLNFASAQSALTLGGGGLNASISVRNDDSLPAVELLALPTESVIGAGQKKRPGRLTLYNGDGNPTVNMTAANATLKLGGGKVNGKVSVQGKDDIPVAEMFATDAESIIGLGQSNRPGRLTVYNGKQEAAIELNGAQGDIWISNADFAEEFDIATDTATVDVEHGMVMTIGENGSVQPSTTAYDSKVVGVISGAGTYKPGLVLDRRNTGNERMPIALVGKVFCMVDATECPVQVGDLLTTSTRLGHAMKATDRYAAFGAVLGKALGPLASGCGLVPILVTLQ